MGYYETDGDGAQVGLTLSSGPLLRQLVVVIHSPLRALQFDTDTNEATFCYIVQSLQAPSAQQYRDLLTAIYHKDVIDVSYLLGRGVGLMDATTEGRAYQHISSLCYPTRPLC